MYAPKDSGAAHAGILQNFANAILYGEELLAPGAEGINELSISNAAYLSSWTGKSVKIPFDCGEFDRLLESRRSASAPKEGGSPQTHGDYSERWQVRF